MFETMTITLREGIEALVIGIILAYLGRTNKVQVMQMCGAPFNRDSLEMGGGCNPIPLKSILEGEQIVMKTEDIGEKADLFKN